jgi:hypothetical protein
MPVRFAASISAGLIPSLIKISTFLGGMASVANAVLGFLFMAVAILPAIAGGLVGEWAKALGLFIRAVAKIVVMLPKTVAADFLRVVRAIRGMGKENGKLLKRIEKSIKKAVPKRESQEIELEDMPLQEAKNPLETALKAVMNKAKELYKNITASIKRFLNKAKEGLKAAFAWLALGIGIAKAKIKGVIYQAQKGAVKLKYTVKELVVVGKKYLLKAFEGSKGLAANIRKLLSGLVNVAVKHLKAFGIKLFGITPQRELVMSTS